MQVHDFLLANCDTDSILISKENGAPFPEEERKALLEELNSLYPNRIEFDDDGYFPCVAILKSKNYILYDGKEIKLKGSSLKSSKVEKALKEFITEIANYIVFDKKDQILDLYHKYIKEVHNLSDISGYCSKKTWTEKVVESDRENEAKIRRAVGDKSIQLGDKIYVYFTQDAELKLREYWTGDHDPSQLTERIYKTLSIFKNVIDMSQFPKYHLKGKKKELYDLLGLPYVEEKKTRKKKTLPEVHAGTD